jgi:hypothetical protein
MSERTTVAPIEGQCLCGAVTIRVPEGAGWVGACHCRMCQRWSGPPAASALCVASTACRGRAVVENGHRRAEGGLAPRRGRRRRQDRRRRRASTCRSRSRFFEDQVRAPGTSRARASSPSGRSSCRAPTSAAQEAARTIVETEVLRMGYYIYGWRHVPVDITCLGQKANATRPEIEQILISNAKGVDEETFERELYVIRRRIEKAGGRHPRLLHLLAVVPVDHLQGHDARRAGGGVLPRPARTRGSRAPSRSITSGIRRTPSRAGGWRSRSGCSPTTARSTR